MIVDPWAKLTGSKQAVPKVDAPVPPPVPPSRELWLGSGELLVDPFVRPSVVPIGPAPVAAPAPQVAPPPRVAAASAPPAPPRLGHEDWAHANVEIVDPWAPRRVAMFTDPVIVDPWAR